MSRIADVIDGVIEFPIVTSFTNVGYRVRRRIDRWRPLDSYDLSGRTVAITGPTSGLGLAAAELISQLGADLILIARNLEKAENVRDRLLAASPQGSTSIVQADIGDLDSVRQAASTILAQHDRLDVLINNAGALTADRRQSPQSLELTTAVHVVGPFLLTGLLLDRLRATPDSRVLTMSSGGMYATGLTVSQLQMEADDYKGAEQYARAKRAQVTLNEMWSEQVEAVRFHALHPGWADTPGVESGLPVFGRVVGPFLRTPAQGADTLVWLASDPEAPLRSTGGFWHDRRQRSIHKLPSTRRTDTAERRNRLWEWVEDASGWTSG